VEELQPERTLSHNPIVQALFVMQNMPLPGKQLGGLDMDQVRVPLVHSKFDLGVFIGEHEGDLMASWLYSTALFDATTIQRLIRRFERLLASAAAQPDARLSALEILSDDEKRQQEDERKKQMQSQSKRLMMSVPRGVGLPAASRKQE
jgi:non-ribosomal peptide synthetase component F